MRRIALLGLALCLGMTAACASGSRSAVVLSTSPATSLSIPGGLLPDTSPPVTTTPASNALLARMVPAVQGYALQPDDVGDTGPSDLAKAQRDAGGGADAQALTDDGFVVGYQQLFEDSYGRQVIFFVYQFATPAGAAKNEARTAAELLSGAGVNVTPRPMVVTGIPGAVGATAPVQGVLATFVEFRRGPYVVEVNTNGSPEDPPPASQAVLEALAQYARLG